MRTMCRRIFLRDTTSKRELRRTAGCLLATSLLSSPGLLAAVFPCQQRLPDGSPLRPCQSALASRPGQQLRHGAPTTTSQHGAPASNKHHSAEKSTPVWLALWRIWAGFANLQLRCATLHSTYSYMYPSTLLPPWSSCSDIANLSAHLHRLLTPPTYLRRIRLSPGRAQVLSAG